MKRLALFAKYWAPGKVKTRLARSVGPKVASEIYLQFLRTLLARPYPADVTKLLVYAPAEREAAFRRLADGAKWSLQPQGSGDLGERLQATVAHAFSSGCQRLVIIGSDSPNLPASFIQQAFDRLEDHEVTLGPTDDGGYYAVGLRAPHRGIFERIEWSTGEVWQQTLMRSEQLKLSCHRLPPWYDVDDLTSLERLRADLAFNDDSHLAHLRNAIDDAMSS